MATFSRDSKDVDFLANIILYTYYNWFAARNSRNDIKALANIEKISSQQIKVG